MNLTNTPEVSEEGAAWSPDGEKLAYSVKPKQSPNYEIDMIEILTKKVTHLTSNTPAQFSNLNPIWSKDGKWIVFTQQRADGQRREHFYREFGRRPRHKSHAASRASRDFPPQTFRLTARPLLITSNAANGYQNAGLLDIATKKITWLTSDKWEVDFR